MSAKGTTRKAAAGGYRKPGVWVRESIHVRSAPVYRLATVDTRR